jgi:Tfp pilus assembly protein PilX
MRRRLKSESGVALVMAVGILAVLMVAGATVVFYAGSNTRSAEYSADNQKAVNLAEAGLNYARSILWASSTPGSASAVHSCSSLPLPSVSLEGGTVNYCGTYDSTTKIWTLTGTGTYTNPTGAAAPVSRTASSQVLVTTTLGIDPAWGYLFADTTSCTLLENNLTIDTPIYVRGDLCMQGSSLITADLVQVRGTVQLKNSASIGTAAARVAQVYVGGGCRYPWSGTYVTPCSDSQQVYRTNFSSTVPDLTKPAVDIPGWYTNAKPGPTTSCSAGFSFPGTFDTDTAPNGSNPSQNLFPGAAYDCRVMSGATQLGRIAYTPGDPATFVIDGVVFFDGPIEFAGNNNVVYQGRGSIYANGKITIRNHNTFCAIVGCTSSWNPDQNLLLLVSGSNDPVGFTIENNTTFQGAIYVVNDFEQQNSVIVCGPVIAQELFISNNTDNCYVPFTTGVPGMPGTAPVTTTLLNVSDSFTTD